MDEAREFTPEEAQRWEEHLSKLFEPTGENFWDLS